MLEPVQFKCDGKRLFGIIHIPDKNIQPGIGFIMVIGGPQTRVGGHRLYLMLAQFLCSNGVTVFRFDYEGMGDSEGGLVGFQGAGPSIDSAVNFLVQKFSNISKIIIWSICDGCPISLKYAADNESRIAGIIMCNPFVLNNDAAIARANLKHYYSRRLLKIQFWIKLIRLKIKFIEELKIVALFIKKTNSSLPISFCSILSLFFVAQIR